MKLTSIKVGKWYETKLGVGECVKAGGTFPPSVQFMVVLPFPRGKVTLGPRDVLREVPDPTTPRAAS